MIYTKVTVPTTTQNSEKRKTPAKPSGSSQSLASYEKTFVFNAKRSTAPAKQTPDKTENSFAKTAEMPEMPIHKPEIVMTEPESDIKNVRFSENTRSAFSHSSQEHTLFERFLPLSGKFALLAALCMISFLFGCTVTDRKLCRVMIAVSAAASGRIPDTPISDTYESVVKAVKSDTSALDKTETFYRKYETSPLPSASGGSVDYLAAHAGALSDSSSANSPLPDSSDTSVPVQTTENGKIGSDSAVLYPVIKSDLRAKDLCSLSNETRYPPDVQSLMQMTPGALQDLSLDGNPLVLIVHTHGTECYNECAADGYYDASQPVRNEDISQNVVSVGTSLAEVLNDFGISTIHDTTMCDKDSFVRAYKTSAALVKSYLEQYPSIRFVIDLHRDSISSPDGSAAAPLFSFAGEEAAQLMLVVGTNAAGASHPNWSDNLSLALHVEKQLSADYPGMFRRINLRSASFNQQLSNGYLLLECGAFANSREQAERAAKLFGTGFARLILQAAKNK